jgi:dolichyl-phosphate beta-glucosyltransferase
MRRPVRESATIRYRHPSVRASETVTAAEPPSRPRCLIVVPVYNESHRLKQGPFFDFLSAQQTSAHAVFFLFVNDGSTDDTLAQLEAMQRRRPDRIFILNKQTNGGKAEAVRDGMSTAFTASGAYQSVGFWDADLATPLSAVPQLLGKLEDRPHLAMVFASRVRLLGREIHRNPARHYLGRLFATSASLTLSLPVYDTQCGAKIFKATPDLEYVLSTPFLSRWIFDVEIVARFIQLKGLAFCFSSIYESPIESWEDVAGSKLHPFDFVAAAVDLFRIHHRYLRKRR